MEFLKGLEAAKQQGLDVETFIKIWETEVKAKLDKLESRDQRQVVGSPPSMSVPSGLLMQASPSGIYSMLLIIKE